MVSYECVCADTPTLTLFGCSGMSAVAAGMCSMVRRLLIGYFMLLSGRLYCCSSQRKSRGERIISQLIPTLLISHHSLPQPLIYRRVNFFSLFSLFWVTNSLFPLRLLFRMVQHYRHSFPEGNCCEIPRRRWWHFSFPLARRVKTEGDGEAGKRNKLSSPHCATPWKLKINKAVCVSSLVTIGISVNTLSL